MEKTNRSVIFCKDQLNDLVDLVTLQNDILLNKRTDKGQWKDKQVARQKITDTLNKKFLTNRTWQHTRAKFYKLKCETKKAVTAAHVTAMKTGPEQMDHDEAMDPQNITCLLREGGAESQCAPPIPEEVSNNEHAHMEEVEEFPSGELSWASFCTASLRTPKIPVLQKSINKAGLNNYGTAEKLSQKSFRKWTDARTEVAEHQMRLMTEEFDREQARRDELHIINKEIALKQSRLLDLQINIKAKNLER